MRKTIIFCLLLALFSCSWAQERVDEKVFSAGTSIFRGILEKVKAPLMYGDREVWGMARASEDFFFILPVTDDLTPVLFYNRLTNEPCFVSNQGITEFFKFAQEGDYIEVEGSSVFMGNLLYYRFFPTRITSYNASIEGVVSMTGNPAFTIPILPGASDCIEISNNRKVFLTNQLGVVNITDGMEPPIIAGVSASYGSSVRVYGHVSQRWDIIGHSYLDIYPTNCYSLSMKPVAGDDEVFVKQQGRQIEIDSNSPIVQVVAYDLEGKSVFQKRMTENAYTLSFRAPMLGFMTIMIETQNSIINKKLNVTQL
ncbi:hypothetical protein [Bacteroides heparinolyticus]|uniref:hypothetical protein n=1 Tax=Prevotella heparinolytica TaxID=28113 RepID=UPI0035A18A90